jgi:signal transduction histidine kinase
LTWANYGLSRTKHYVWSAALMIVIADAAIFGLLFFQPNVVNPVTVNFLLMTVILGSLLFSIRTTFYIVVLHTVGTLLLPIFSPQIAYLGVSIGFVMTTSLLLLVFMWHRDILENDRQADLAKALKQTEEANRALSQANAMAKETMRLKSEFMSTMSHELRTPLNAITGFCGIMLEGMGGEIDDEARHMVGRIGSNSDRLLTLINQVLDIAKMEADRLDLVSAPITPASLAMNWKTQVSVLAEKKGLAFNIEVDPALPSPLLGDPERLTQIALNLLSNAIKFTETGGVKLTMKRDAKVWIIEVRDTGVGIPPHALNYIFDEFRQVDGSSTRSYGGSGLGLAIVRKLCLLMDGNVRATSELGKGSVFTVTLPLRTPKEASEPTATLVV